MAGEQMSGHGTVAVELSLHDSKGLAETRALGASVGRDDAGPWPRPQVLQRLVLEMRRVQQRRLSRDTVTKEEAESCPRSQVSVSRGQCAVVSNAAERSTQTTMRPLRLAS